MLDSTGANAAKSTAIELLGHGHLVGLMTDLTAFAAPLTDPAL